MYTVESSVSEIICSPLVNVPLGLDLTIVRQAIHFVDEHLKLNCRVDLVCPCNRLVKPYQCWSVVVLATREQGDGGSRNKLRSSPEHLSRI